jgi:ABC-type sugar transport system ATPase subunit
MRTKAPVSEQAAVAVELRAIGKRFPGVVALDRVDMQLRRGEVHALLGENGAGKSTLVKILTGVQPADEGELVLDGEPTRFATPHDAQTRGISFVPQDVLTAGELSIGRNILLGGERFATRLGALSRGEREAVQAALARIGADFSPDVQARLLSVPQLRLAQLARALMNPGDVLVLDEPTAVLSEHESARLLTRLRALRDEGKAIVYVTHRLSEVMELADRVTILRDGRRVGYSERATVSREEIIALMAKDEAADGAPRAARTRRRSEQPPALEVSHLSAGTVRDVSFVARPGEITGIAGVQGSGHGRLLQAIAGVRTVERGTATVAGHMLRPGSVRDAFKHGLMLVPADRRGAGIVGPLSVRENLMLSGRLDPGTRQGGLRWPRRERALAGRQIERLSIRTRSSETTTGTLSGGNQQKVVIARALESSPEVLLVEEPTQGIDVHAKREIWGLLNDLVSDGACLVVASSEFEELLEFADVIHVMCLGRMVATLDGASATYREILSHALD